MSITRFTHSSIEALAIAVQILIKINQLPPLACGVWLLDSV
jgi:hypothetical protein